MIDPAPAVGLRRFIVGGYTGNTVSRLVEGVNDLVVHSYCLPSLTALEAYYI